MKPETELLQNSYKQLVKSEGGRHLIDWLKTRRLSHMEEAAKTRDLFLLDKAEEDKAILDHMTNMTKLSDMKKGGTRK